MAITVNLRYLGMCNPIKRTIFVPKKMIKETLLISGYSALSEYSMLNPLKYNITLQTALLSGRRWLQVIFKVPKISVLLNYGGMIHGNSQKKNPYFRGNNSGYTLSYSVQGKSMA